jgi:hypothetical protein
MNKIIYQDDSHDLRKAAGFMSQYINPNSLVKSAASEVFSKEVINANLPDDDHFMVHLIAMGGHPTYLPNRNGDAFPSESLEKHHTTFVKNGCFFREHKNRCQKTEGIGLVKASAYDKATDRVELLIWGNKKKAEEEYELAKQGSELSFSMSCKLPNDECSICGNKSKTLSEYCDHLKGSMNKYLPEFRKYAFAYNREPNFFDISRVKRPADRIAHYLEYKFGPGDLQKAASSGLVIPGAAWAEYENFSVNTLPSKYADLIGKLAYHENYINKCAHVNDRSPLNDYINSVLPNAVAYEASNEELTKISKLAPSTLFYKLNKSASILPYYSLISYVTGKDIEELKQDPEVSLGKSQIEFGYTHLQKQGCGADMEEMTDMFNPAPDCLCEITDPANTDAIDEVMKKLSDKFSCKVEPVKKRVVITIIKAGSLNNKAFKEPEEECKLNKWASVYMAYQLNSIFNIAKCKNLCDTDEVNTDLAYAVALNRFS